MKIEDILTVFKAIILHPLFTESYRLVYFELHRGIVVFWCLKYNCGILVPEIQMRSVNGNNLSTEFF